MSPHIHAKVLIAGGSIAGLTLANILEQIGIDFLVLEKYGEIAPDLGASIAIFPNGFRILDQLGCYDDITALFGDSDAFKFMASGDEHGKTVFNFPNVSQHFVKRMGYMPFFVDRKMVIQVLYDKLRDKSKVLTLKGVFKVEQIAGGIKVITSDGDIFTGDILVGADGIHSTVRREMWKLADQEHPGYFSISDRTNVPTEYCCIFGISRPTDKFPKYTSKHVMGHNYSHLIAAGPDHRIYWFLFKKLPTVVRGLYEKIPRYTDAEMDALAAEHANDRLTETLNFGELYETRRVATLQATPEVVFSKWHYNRIITIGDAAHKFNPIGGQGGNSAIEDAAVLSNHLYALMKQNGKDAKITDASIVSAFEDTQRLRHDRAVTLMKKSHSMQSVQARETFITRLVAKYIVPRVPLDQILERLCNDWRPAARLEMLDVPARKHCELWYDERPAQPFDSALVRIFASAVFMLLAYSAAVTMQLPDVPALPKFLGFEPKTHYTGIGPLDKILTMIVLFFADGIGWTDTGHSIQFFYLLLLLTPILLIWYIEGYRQGSRGSPITWASLYGVVMNFTGIGMVAPVYFLISVWTSSTGSYTNGIGRNIPEHVAQAIVPAIFLGYVVPTLLMFAPWFPRAYLQELTAMWQFASIFVSISLTVLAKSFSQQKQKLSRSTGVFSPEIYSRRDIPHLFKAYKITFTFSFLYHISTIILILFTHNPAISFIRLLFPNQNLAEQDLNGFAAGMFTFLKWDFAFATINLFLYGLYSLYELRRRGLVTTQQALSACGGFVVAQVLVGPGAAIVGLWWWREQCMSYEKKSLGKEEGDAVSM